MALNVDHEETCMTVATQIQSSRRTVSQIAADIRKEWGSKVNYAAKPYLDAMAQLDCKSTVGQTYYADSAESVVRYFLSNASSFRGDKAKALKEELKLAMKPMPQGAV